MRTNRSPHPWVHDLTIGEAVQAVVTRHPSREALVFPQQGVRLNYEQFLEEVSRVARALLAVGVQAGEHVGIWSTNWPQWVLTQFATATIGAPLVNLNPAYRSHELEYVLRQADITTLVLLKSFKSSRYLEILRGVCPELSQATAGRLKSSRLPRLRRIISITDDEIPGLFSWQEFLRAGGKIPPTTLAQRQSRVRPGDTVNIQYTSGTTGFPKGVQLSHHNLLMNAYYVGGRMELTPDDRICLPVPFYHCFGCVLGNMVSLLHGCALIVPAESFDAKATLMSVQRERCSAIYGVPAMFIAELNDPDFSDYDFRSLRTGIMAGSPCPVEIMKRVVREMGAAEITIVYGLTEASPAVTQTSIHDTLEHRVNTVGTPLPGLEVRIVSPESSETLPAGRPGELLVRGHAVMKGYYKLPEETAATITRNGWLHTGDLAAQTPDGYFKITGRIKDLIIRGGENIYPREIEEYLFNMPEIRDVQVVGLPDKRFGEVVSAWIVLKQGASLTEQQVQDFCRDKISYFKIPHYVVFLDNFPTTVTGKAQKFKIRELGIKKFGLQEEAGIETA